MTGIEGYQSKTKLSLRVHRTKTTKKSRVIADPARLKYLYNYCDVVFIANYCLNLLRPNTPRQRIPEPKRSMVAGSGMLGGSPDPNGSIDPNASPNWR